MKNLGFDPDKNQLLLNAISKGIKSSFLVILRSLSQSATMGNSIASISPIFCLNDALKAADMHMESDMKMGLNYVHVYGLRPKHEKLHFHTSLLIGLATHGEGYVDTTKDGVEVTLDVHSGDLVIIPEGVLHTFHCPESKTLGYAVIEVGSNLDGQAHHYQ